MGERSREKDWRREQPRCIGGKRQRQRRQSGDWRSQGERTSKSIGVELSYALQFLAADVPAGAIAEVRKQRVDAGLHDGRIEAELEFPALVGNLPVAANLDRAECSTGIRADHAVPK